MQRCLRLLLCFGLLHAYLPMCVGVRVRSIRENFTVGNLKVLEYWASLRVSKCLAHSTVAIVTCCYCSFCYHYHFPVSHSEKREGGLRLQSQIKTRIRIRIKGERERMSLTLTHTHTHIAEVECQMRNINVRNFQDILHYSHPPLPAPLEQQEQQFFSACRVLGAHALLESPLWRLINGNN